MAKDTARTPHVKRVSSAEYLPQPDEDQAHPAEPQKTVFIPGWLDDAGLTPAQFRVYCRIARSPQCWQRLRILAVGCRMDRETVQRAIQALVDLGLVEKQKRFGQSSMLQLVPSGKDGLGSKTTQRQRRANHLAGKPATEGTLLKVLSVRGDPRRLEDWQLEKDINRLTKQISDEAQGTKPNPEVLRRDRARLTELRAEKARRAPPPKAKPVVPNRPPASARPVTPPGQFGGVTLERWNELATETKEAIIG